MNKILPLFQEEYALDFLRRQVLPQYPAFAAISRLSVEPYKKMVWETTYHVVINYLTYFLDHAGREIKIPIVCSAHSDEPRENIYQALKYLESRHFSNANFVLPRPLFYSPEFRGTFYRGLHGKNLLYYLIKDQRDLIRTQIKLAAGLLARLHGLVVGPEANFNPINSRIETVIPGVLATIQEMKQRYGSDIAADFQKIYRWFISQEERFFLSGERLSLIHGDAHPENFIITKPTQIGLIDFTDFCLGDPARDLGTFLQQLDYKFNKKIKDIGFVAELRRLFLNNYLSASGLTLNSNLQERIDLYYNWTAIRTSVYWFLKHGHSESRGRELLEQVKNNLSLIS